MKLDELEQLLLDNANPEKAVSMKAYMRDQFEFLGIPKTERTALCKPYFKEAKKTRYIDWSFVNDCWATNTVSSNTWPVLI